MSAPVPYAHVQAFSCLSSGVLGNGATVLLLPPAPPLHAAACVRAAAFFAQSETACLQPRAGAGAAAAAADEFDLRWFTPAREVPLCGHATLAAAAALWRWRAPAPPRALTFWTASGALAVRPSAAGAPVLRFPALALAAVAPAAGGAAGVYARLVAALAGGAAAAAAALHFSPASGKLVAVLAGAGAWPALAALAAGGPATDAALLAVDQAPLPAAARVTGVCLTARAPPGALAGAHFGSRYFTPWNGIAEDAVNGSSHCALAPLWADALGAWRAVRGGGGAPAAKNGAGQQRGEDEEEEEEEEAAELVALQLSRAPAGGVLRLRAVRGRSGGRGQPAAAAAAYVELCGEAEVLAVGRAAVDVHARS
jgi:predicted PhzF superfamily epimerase YddE/YHI9